jgi:hypothetical protein
MRIIGLIRMKPSPKTRMDIADNGRVGRKRRKK